MTERTGRGQLLAAFAAVYVLWGSTYLAVAFAVQSIPPFLMIGVRSLVAGATLFGLAQVREPRLPSARAWASALIKFVIPAVDRPKVMTLAALIPGLAGVALFMIPVARRRCRRATA
jgi:drug/metabolite transporter (DMT)-like permease